MVRIAQGRWNRPIAERANSGFRNPHFLCLYASFILNTLDTPLRHRRGFFNQGWSVDHVNQDHSRQDDMPQCQKNRQAVQVSKAFPQAQICSSVDRGH